MGEEIASGGLRDRHLVRRGAIRLALLGGASRGAEADERIRTPRPNLAPRRPPGPLAGVVGLAAHYGKPGVLRRRDRGARAAGAERGALGPTAAMGGCLKRPRLPIGSFGHMPVISKARQSAMRLAGATRQLGRIVVMPHLNAKT